MYRMIMGHGWAKEVRRDPPQTNGLEALVVVIRLGPDQFTEDSRF